MWTALQEANAARMQVPPGVHGMRGVHAPESVERVSRGSPIVGISDFTRNCRRSPRPLRTVTAG